MSVYDDINWRRDGASFPLVAYADGSTEPITLDGDQTLSASTTYRCPLLIKYDDGISIQWQQTNAGAGSISSHRFLITNTNTIDLANLGSSDVWSDVSASYAFTDMPSGSQASEHYPIANLLGCAMLLELTVGGSNVTGVSFRAQVRQ